MAREKLPAGCAIPIFIVIAIFFYFSTKDSPEEIERQNKMHEAFLSKYDYNPDTLANNFTYLNYETSNGNNPIKYKILVLYNYKDKISFNPQATASLPDNLIAFKHSELNTIVLESHSEEMISEWGAHGEFQEQAELKFIDYKTKQLLLNTSIRGYHRFESNGRRGSTTYYKLYETDVANEINKIINEVGL